MSSQNNNNKNVENARRFLWDNNDKTGDNTKQPETASSNTARSRSAHTNLSRGRDYAVDQSVNLMDLGGVSGMSSGAGGGASSRNTTKPTSGTTPSTGLSGLFRASREVEHLNRFDEYGDAAPMTADAEEYIDDDDHGKRRRYLFCHPGTTRAKATAKAVLTMVVALVGFLLVMTTLNSLRLPGKNKSMDTSKSENKNENENNDNVGSNSNSGSDSDSGSGTSNNKLFADAATQKRYESIVSRIVEENVTPKNIFESGQKSPQQSALDWLVFEDPAALPHDHIGLLDRYGLVVMYFSSTNASTSGVGGWKHSDHWLTGTGICKWHGVACLPKEQEATASNNYAPVTRTYDENNFVTALKLDANKIEGILPNELGTAFAELLTIDLEENEIGGTLPAALGQSQKLKDLLVGKNQLVGTLPEQFERLSNLHQCNVAYNQLEGPIWHTSWSSSLIKLRYFAASHNQLTGTFPDLSSMTKMTGLYLDGNDLGGPIPEYVGSMTALLDLRISENRFSGDITHLKNLKNLETVHLSDNEFTGSIPDMFDNLYRLHELVMSNNKLVGSIPRTLTHLQTLKTLNLDSNQLDGTLPPGLGLLTDIITLSLKDNKFEGTIPILLGKLDDIKTLSLNHNQLTGTIPSELGLCFRLVGLHLQNNQLTGTIPIQLGELTGLSNFRLEANGFEGVEMPPQVCALRDDDMSVLASDCSDRKKVACDCCTECL